MFLHLVPANDEHEGGPPAIGYPVGPSNHNLSDSLIQFLLRLARGLTFNLGNQNLLLLTMNCHDVSVALDAGRCLPMPTFDFVKPILPTSTDLDAQIPQGSFCRFPRLAHLPLAFSGFGRFARAPCNALFRRVDVNKYLIATCRRAIAFHEFHLCLGLKHQIPRACRARTLRVSACVLRTRTHHSPVAFHPTILSGSAAPQSGSYHPRRTHFANVEYRHARGCRTYPCLTGL